MWAFAVMIVGVIAKYVILKILVGAFFVAMAVCWEDWGKDLLIVIAAVICIVGLIYVGAAYVLGTAAGYSVTAYDIAIIVAAGIVGLPKLIEWFMAVVEMIIECLLSIVAALVDAVANTFPWVKPLIIGMSCLWGYQAIFGDSGTTTVVSASAPAEAVVPQDNQQMEG